MSDDMTREERSWCQGIVPTRTNFQSAVSNNGVALTVDDIEDRADARREREMRRRISLPEPDFYTKRL